MLRWSTQRAYDQYKDHLVGQLTSYFWPFGPFWTFLDDFGPFRPFLAILTIFGHFDHFWWFWPFFTIFHHFHNFYHFYFQFEQVFLSQNSWNLVTLYPLVNPQLSSSVSLPRTSICPAMNLYPGSVSWYHGICQCWSLCSKNSYREHMLCAVLILILTIHLFQIFHIVTMMHIM